jgi:hypothetical protein
MSVSTDPPWMAAGMACACVDGDCLQWGCKRQRSALPTPWPMTPVAPLCWPPTQLPAPALGYRYRIEQSGVVYYERDPSASPAAATMTGAAA